MRGTLNAQTRVRIAEGEQMKKNTLEKVYLSLRDLSPQINMPEELMNKARLPIDRMMALS
jgi:quinolinate synthase